MVLPVVAYGHPVLRKKTLEIDKDYPDLDSFINDMWETMYYSNGIGMAANQMNRSIRIFIVNASSYYDNIESKNLKKVFINPEVIYKQGEKILQNEGCLSIPGITEDVERYEQVRINYYDQDWNFHDKWYDGIMGHIIQHEYDHLEGVLFTDKLSPLRKTMISKRLSNISK